MSARIDETEPLPSPVTRSGRRTGFTAVELVLVVMIAGILIAMVVPQFGRIESRRAVANARDAVVLLAARARTEALGRGSFICLEIDPATDHAVAYVDGDASAVVDEINYSSGDVAADVDTSSGGVVKVCYTARGFALPSRSSTNLPDTVTFSRGPEGAEALVRLAGQVEKL